MFKGFIFSNPPADSSHTLYFARVGITRFKTVCKELRYKGPKIKFEGIAVFNNKEYGLDWPSGQEFSVESKLFLLRKRRSDGRVFLCSNGQIYETGLGDHIGVRIFPKDSKDTDVGGIDETWKVKDILEEAIEWDYKLI